MELPAPIYSLNTQFLILVIVTGTCVAVVDHYPMVKDELLFNKGDLIEVEGLLMSSMNMFIGRRLFSGHIGFVHKAHVKPENVKPL